MTINNMYDINLITKYIGYNIYVKMSDLNLKENSLLLFQNSSIRLKLSNGSVFEYLGTFKYTDNKIDKNTNSLAVYTHFKNDNQLLLPNSFVTVEVNSQFKNTVLISKELVQMLPDGNFLFIARNNLPQKVKIKILAETDTNYIIENSFQPDDLLIIGKLPDIPHGATIHFNIVN